MTGMSTKRVVALAAAALVVLAAGTGIYVFKMRTVAAVLVDAAQGTVPSRVSGPGTVQARIAVTLASRITASVVAVHADVGDAVKLGAVLPIGDVGRDRDVAQARAREEGHEVDGLRGRGFRAPFAHRGRHALDARVIDRVATDDRDRRAIAAADAGHADDALAAGLRAEEQAGERQDQDLQHGA